MAGKKDSKGRVLKSGESQMADGRYRYRFTDESGNRQAVYSWKLFPTDKTPAGKKDSLSLREQEEQLLINKHDGIRTATKKYTLNDMFNSYMDSKRDIKERTKLNYTRLYRKNFAETIGKKRLEDIHFSDMKRLYNRLHDDGLSVGTLSNLHSILHAVFDFAVRDNLIRVNPSDRALCDIKKLHRGETEKRHALTIEEQSLLIDFLNQSETFRHWKPLITFLLGTGCRVGETIGLRWKDIDFKNRTISINHSVSYFPDNSGKYTFHISTPKTNAGSRIIPMLNEVYEALKEEQKRQLATGTTFSSCDIDGYTGFIFTTSTNNIFSDRAINAALKSITKACNKWESKRAAVDRREPLQIRPFSVHNLRHTFCTRFCENETNLKVIQEIMGHANITMTMNVYAEATAAKKAESFSSLQGKIKIG